MKCIHCGTDSNLKQRRAYHGSCRGCRHPFAFEPSRDPLKVGDLYFKRVVDNLSGNGSLTYTDRQLWYAFNRRWRRPRSLKGMWRTFAFVAGGGGFVAGVIASSFLPLLAGGAGAVSFALLSRRAAAAPLRAVQPKVAFRTFANKYLARWTEVHGPPPRLLPPPSYDAPSRATDLAPDVTSYSFDRALVVDSGPIAAMLVANNFHFEHNCAVLSLDGYPYGMANTVLTMLRRNPQLTVFALHDASAEGCSLPNTLRGPRWFPDPAVRIVDLGLRPRDARALNLPLEQRRAPPLSDFLRASLRPDEVAWLEAGNVAELAALRPARLMRAAFQGFARFRAGESADAGDGGVTAIWIMDSNADIYAADSFG